jgi:hypothetical protein
MLEDEWQYGQQSRHSDTELGVSEGELRVFLAAVLYIAANIMFEVIWN